jgi:hypothetical protein
LFAAAPSDVGPYSSDVALDKVGPPTHLNATKRWHRLEDDEDAAQIARQVPQLDVALGDHDLEGVVFPRQHPDASDARRHRRWLAHTTAGDHVRGTQPAAVIAGVPTGLSLFL